MKTWLIKMLGGYSLRDVVEREIAAHKEGQESVIIDESASERRWMRLIDYTLNGVFFKLDRPPSAKPKKPHKAANISLAQLESKLRANLTAPIKKPTKHEKNPHR